MVLLRFNKISKEWQEIPKEERQPTDLYMDSMLRKCLEHYKRVQKHDNDVVLIISGNEGCLTGDTVISTNRNELGRPYSLKWLYNQFNHNPEKMKGFQKPWDLSRPTYVRSFTGDEIRLHKIKNITYSGKKDVWKLMLDNDYEIRATPTHKFMTRRGWIPLDSITTNDEVMCDNLHPQKSNRKRIKLYDIQLSVGENHPYAINRRVEVHRLIYEAHMNGLDFLDYLDLLLNEKEISSKMHFINPTLYHIHHKDGCHYNNSIDNLELVNAKEHCKYHGNENYSNFSQGSPIFVKVKDIIKDYSYEDTYDIECEEPHHNFVANGIVAHNSGKSTMMANILEYISDGEFNPVNDMIGADYLDGLEKIEKVKQRGWLGFDEGNAFFLATETMKREHRDLHKIFSIFRQKNLFVVISLPGFFRIGSYFALDRSAALVRTYIQEGQRGYFAYYGRKAKDKLYRVGKAGHNDNAIRPTLRGRFGKCDKIENPEYKEFKQETLESEISKAKEKYRVNNKEGLTEHSAKRKYNMEFIRNNSDLTINEIAHRLGYTPRRISQLKKEMDKL